MKGFLNITKIHLPFRCIAAAYQLMRTAGHQHVEGVALFAGKESGETFTVSETIVPKQYALSIEQGLLYSVPGEELHRINVHLYERELALISQIHSHPNAAFHSETDDAYPIVTTVGGLSIVVPDFAFGPITVESWAVYRLSSENVWTEVNEEEVKELIYITE